MCKKEINKSLIPALLAGAIGQRPKQPINDSKMLQDYNIAFNVILLAAEDVVNPGDNIDMAWCIRTLYQVYNQQIKSF